MALQFEADGDRVNHGSGVSLDNIVIGTCVFLCYSDGGTEEGRFFDKGSPFRFEMRLDGATQFGPTLTKQRATQSLFVRATNLAAHAAYGTAKWIVVAGVWNENGIATDQRLYMGDMAMAMSEPSGYNVQRQGIGGVVSDAANELWVGSDPGTTALEWNGRMLFAGFWSKQLTLQQLEQLRQRLVREMIEHRFDPLPPFGDCRLYAWYGGAWGTGTQPDWSGYNNHGTTVVARPLTPIVHAAFLDEEDERFAATGHPAMRRWGATPFARPMPLGHDGETVFKRRGDLWIPPHADAPRPVIHG